VTAVDVHRKNDKLVLHGKLAHQELFVEVEKYSESDEPKRLPIYVDEIEVEISPSDPQLSGNLRFSSEAATGGKGVLSFLGIVP